LEHLVKMRFNEPSLHVSSLMVKFLRDGKIIVKLGYLAALGLCIFFARAASAQSDPAQAVELFQRQAAHITAQWIHSPDARLRAWGAYWVLRERQTQFIPDLLSQVANYVASDGASGGDNTDAHDAMIAVLDALIQLDASVPIADTIKLRPEFRAQAFILLAHSGHGSSEPLLAIFQNEHSWPAEWLAAGNLLAAGRVPGFAAAVLRGMTVHALVKIRLGVEQFGMGVGHGCGARIVDPRSGWPEVGNYDLVAPGEGFGNGVVLLAFGRDPSYYGRSVDAYYLDQDPGCEPVDFDLLREHLLGDLLDTPEDKPLLRTRVSTDITWKDPQSYVGAVRGLIEEQEKLFGKVAKDLKICDLLTQDEAAQARPTLVINLWDLRGPSPPPLPAVPDLPPNVTIRR
jgi:hypothetical protein